jgi:hypothetical protein
VLTSRLAYLPLLFILSGGVSISLAEADGPIVPLETVNPSPANRKPIRAPLSANALKVRNINRIKRADMAKLSYAENLAFVFNGAPLYPHPTSAKQNRSVLKKDRDYLVQIIDGNDAVENVPDESYFVIDCQGLDFAVKSQDERLAEGSHIALHLGSIRPSERSATELSFFAIWLSVRRGEPGTYPAVVRLVFKNGMELKRNVAIVVQ